jgi:hypothetical protein
MRLAPTPYDILFPPAVICQAPRDELLRCHCPTCLRLDREFPGQGYQLSLERWIDLGLVA